MIKFLKNQILASIKIIKTKIKTKTSTTIRELNEPLKNLKIINRLSNVNETVFFFN